MGVDFLLETSIFLLLKEEKTERIEAFEKFLPCLSLTGLFLFLSCRRLKHVHRENMQISAERRESQRVCVWTIHI